MRTLFAIIIAGFVFLGCGRSHPDKTSRTPPAPPTQHLPTGDAGGPGCAPYPDYTPTIDEAGAVQWCLGATWALCQRWTDCRAEVEAYFGQSYGSVSHCADGTALGCVPQNYAGERQNVDATAACIELIDGAACAEIDAARTEMPLPCALSTEPPPAGDATGCLAIQPGVHNAHLSGAETGTWGVQPAQKFCVCLEAGDRVDIVVADGPDSATSLGDSKLDLVDPVGNWLSSHDDIDFPDNRYSHIIDHPVYTAGPHMIVVRGFSSAVTGDFEISIAVR